MIFISNLYYDQYHSLIMTYIPFILTQVPLSMATKILDTDHTTYFMTI